MYKGQYERQEFSRNPVPSQLTTYTSSLSYMSGICIILGILGLCTLPTPTIPITLPFPTSTVSIPTLTSVSTSTLTSSVTSTLTSVSASNSMSSVATSTLTSSVSTPTLTSVPFPTPTAVPAGPIPVDLGTAANYTILAKSGVSTVPQSRILGDVGLSPAAATFLTGFSLTKSSTGQSASSVQVTGSLFASDFVTPTPQNLGTAIGDMITAYNDAVGRVPTSTNVGAGGLGGLTLAAGTYKFTSAVNIATDLTLVGTPLDTWIFQIAGGLRTASTVQIILLGGAQPRNIVWAVAGAVSIGTTSAFQGVILGATSATLRTGASLNGRILVQTAVALQQAIVTSPGLNSSQPTN